MIIRNVDFSPLSRSIEESFASYLDERRLNKFIDQLTENIRVLADANLKCYQANMTVIAERKKGGGNTQLIADMELQARTVGERRVNVKAAINALINSAYPLTNESNSAPKNWMSDDIVYSIGEMIDRLTIERIKVEDYRERLSEKPEMATKIKHSQMWSERINQYLDFKLQEVEQKGFYECVEETRTYDMKGISG